MALGAWGETDLLHVKINLKFMNVFAVFCIFFGTFILEVAAQKISIFNSRLS